jgi:hypothetical protein
VSREVTMNWALKLQFPVIECSIVEFMQLKAEHDVMEIGICAEADKRYCNGFRMVYRDVVRLENMYFSRECCNGKWIFSRIEWKDSYVPAADKSIEVSGVPSEDVVLFNNREDVLEWMLTLKDPVMKDVYVEEKNGYHGCAFVYRAMLQK